MAWRKPANIREWVGIVQRHKKKFFFPAVGVMIAVVIASHWVPREYNSEAVFERINDAALQQMGSQTIDRNLSAIRRALNQNIMGRSAIEQLVEDLQMTKDLPHTSDGELTAEGQLAKYDLVQSLQERIKVHRRIQSAQMDQIVVSFTDTDLELAPMVVNQVVENYIRRTRQQLDEMLLNAKTFFSREVSRYRARVRELESKKLRFELDHPGLTPDDPASTESKLVELRSRLDAANHERQITIERRNKLVEWIKTQPEFIEKSQTGPNPAREAYFERRAQLEAELENHLYTMGRTEAHPAVKRVRQRLAELEGENNTTDDQVVVGKEIEPNTNRMAAEREVETLSGTLVALERQSSELTAQVEQLEILKRNFFVVRNEYIQINRDLSESSSQLVFWENNLRRTTIALTAEIGQRGVRLRLLERAPDIARPVKPTISGILSIAGFGGLGIGALIILLAEVLDPSFRSIEQAVDELKLPVLGAVNEIITPRERMRRKVMGWGVYPTLGAVMVLCLITGVAVTHLSLNSPRRFDSLMRSPGRFIEQTLFGRASHTTPGGGARTASVAPHVER